MKKENTELIKKINQDPIRKMMHSMTQNYLQGKKLESINPFVLKKEPEILDSGNMFYNKDNLDVKYNQNVDPTNVEKRVKSFLIETKKRATQKDIEITKPQTLHECYN